MSEESKTVSSGRGKVLEYMWIEKYRSFKNNEFHFDNEYTYSYDPEKNILTRIKNKGYIKDFFGKHISVSAIVGKNGSGKTSLLSAVMEIFNEKQNEELFFILAFKDGEVRVIKEGKIGVFSFEKGNKEEVVSLDMEKSNVPHSKPLDISCIYYTQVLDWSQYNGKKSNVINLSNGSLIRSSEETNSANPANNFFKSEINKQFNFLMHFDKDVQDSIELHKPKYVTFTSMYYNENKIINNIISYLESDTIFQKNLDMILYDIVSDNKFNNEYYSFKSLRFYEENVRDEIKKFINHIFNFFIVDVNEIKKFHHDYMINKCKGYLSHTIVYALCSYFGKQKRNENQYYILLEAMLQTIKENKDQESNHWDNLLELLCKISKKNIITEIILNSIKYLEQTTLPQSIIYIDDSSHKFSFIVEYDEKNFYNAFVEGYGPLLNHFGIFEFSWNLSSGEICRLELFSRLYSETDEDFNDYDEDRGFLLLLDEADMLLHPKWQQRFVHDISKVFPVLFKGNYVQVIIATHSPIMLSDIPKQNTLFLKDDNTEEPKETFAANIYSLFKESFFLDSGMIGAFAEEKLKELAKDIYEMEGNSDSASIKQRIEMIGDKFVRGHFRELYYKKIDAYNIIEAKKAQIADLQKDVEELEKKNNSERKD